MILCISIKVIYTTYCSVQTKNYSNIAKFKLPYLNIIS